MKRSVKIAIGGVFSALSLLFLLLTLFPYATYGLTALAGVMLLPVALECGYKWAFAAYGAVAVLSLLIVPDMEAKWLFVLFFGYYPLLKLLLERLKKGTAWLLKLATFNAAMVGSYSLMLFVLGLDGDMFELFGVHLPFLLLLLGNAVFVLYDRVLSGFVVMYCSQWHDRLFRLWR